MDLREGLEKAVKAVGTKAELGRRLGMSRAALYFWKCVPANRIVQVEQVTGVPREELRPDLYVR